MLYYFIANLFTCSLSCLILIQGAGIARPGYVYGKRNRVWSMYGCINESLIIGSMIPYVEWAHSKGYSIIIANPNLNNDPETKVSTYKWL